MKSKLFGNDGQPAEDMLDIVCGIHAPNYFAVRLFRAPDMKKPSVGPLSTVKMEPRLKVRRDKQTPMFAALLKLNFPFPTADELLFLAHNVNTQFWVSVTEEQGSLVDPPSEKDEPKEEQPKLRAAK